MSSSVLPLWRTLAAILPADVAVPQPTGPRRWWAGPLDVEGLALGSAQAFATALGALLDGDSARIPGLDAAAVAASFGSFAHLRVNGQACAGFAPLSGFYPTADGWIRLHANYPHHAAALSTALGVADRESVATALLDMDAVSAEESIRRASGVAAAVCRPEQWLDTDTAHSQAGRSWIEFATSPCGSRAPFSPAAGARPLEGLRVLDLTRVIAGPSGSRLLGALGADVLRLDPPQMPELWDHHLDTGFDKRSAEVDLRDADGRAAVRALLPAADVVMLGYRLEGLRRFGFDPQSLRDTHPHLCVVSLDAWGRSGPRGGLRGFDSIVQAATGIAHLYGSGSGTAWKPGALPVQALDHATGLGMAAAALTLLWARHKGVAGSAHLSLSRTALELLQAPVPPDESRPLDPPRFSRCTTADGHVLEYVGPPLSLGGRPAEFRTPPQPYGTAPLAWAG